MRAKYLGPGSVHIFCFAPGPNRPSVFSNVSVNMYDVRHDPKNPLFTVRKQDVVSRSNQTFGTVQHANITLRANATTVHLTIVCCIAVGECNYTTLKPMFHNSADGTTESGTDSTDKPTTQQSTNGGDDFGSSGSSNLLPQLSTVMYSYTIVTFSTVLFDFKM